MNKNSFYRIIVLALFATAVAWHILTVAESSYTAIAPDFNLEQLEEKDEEAEQVDEDIQTEDDLQSNVFERNEEIKDEPQEVVYKEVDLDENQVDEDIQTEDDLQNKVFESYNSYPIEKIERNDEIKDAPQQEVVYKEVDLDEKLTVGGVISETNKERQREKKTVLNENENLKIAAQIKLNDLFAFQYFAHDNESGEMGADYLANLVSYEYILIGENLALGNFEDDQDLVQAWMDSPGHRSNILRDGYTEIGVALKEGKFDGKKVWIAVQIFGTPLSKCSRPDEELESQVEEKNIFLEILKNEIDYLTEQLTNSNLSTEQYNEMAERYNLIVEDYNDTVLEVETLLDLLNEQIDIFNDCVKEIN